METKKERQQRIAREQAERDQEVQDSVQFETTATSEQLADRLGAGLAWARWDQE